MSVNTETHDVEGAVIVHSLEAARLLREYLAPVASKPGPRQTLKILKWQVSHTRGSHDVYINYRWRHTCKNQFNAKSDNEYWFIEAVARVKKHTGRTISYTYVNPRIETLTT